MQMEMGPSKSLCFLFFFLVQCTLTAISQPDFFLLQCSDKANYTNDSIYKKNLDAVLSSISSDTHTDYGYYNFSAGEDPDKVYAIALCRGTVPLDKCRSCVNESTHRILQVCPNQKEAMGWYGDCQIRYSNNSFYGVRDSSVMHFFSNVFKASDVEGFNEALRSLLDRLREKAASGTSLRKSANGDVAVPSPSFDRIYGLVDCTPDLSSSDCNGCLAQLMSFIPGCCNGSIGARIVTTSCQLEYEDHLFYDPLPPPPPPPPAEPPPQPPPPSTEGDNMKTITIVIIIVGSTISFSILMIIVYIFLRMRKLKHKKALENAENDEISSADMLQFDFDAIKIATDDFSSENKLGQGGFGVVYKGKLPNGEMIAVKRLANDSAQGDVEFRNEVLLVAKLQHRNLVRLLGFCLQRTRNERLLIYEFVPNGSLDHFIFDLPKRILLDWNKRYKIILGIARGLVYLHEDSQLRVIHRDLKASNILLDAEMNPKIADFGMARLFGLDETRGQTNRIVGTFGYMAPEYAIHGRYSTKSDVFSFGILVLEIITGQKIYNFCNGDNPEDLLTFAWKKWREGRGLDIMDSTLGSESRMEIMRCIHIGLLCVQENVGARPAMAWVVVMLNSHSQSLPLPSKPAFLLQSGVDQSNPHHSPTTSNRMTISSQSSQNAASITDLYPR